MDYYFVLFWIGRVLFGGYFLLNGINHFLHLNQMAEYAATKKVPLPKLAVAAAGLLLVFGGVGILVGTYLVWAVAALALFLIPTTLIMHNFWSVSDPRQRNFDMTQFYKNLALLGALLILLGF